MASPTKNEVMAITIKTTAKVIKSRFVTFDGKQAASDAGVIGVALHNANEGQTLAVEVLGVTLVEAAGSITAGAAITSDAQGLAVAGGTGSAIALTGASSTGDMVKVLLR